MFRLCFFFTVWVFAVFVAHLACPCFLPADGVKTSIIVVAVAALLLNVYYANYYTLRDNQRRLWFEIVFHLVPLLWVLRGGPFRFDPVLVLSMLLVYVLVVGPRIIVRAYRDPLRFLE